MVETYTLEGYLEPKEIRSQYDYEFGYYSEVACREKQKQQLLGEIANIILELRGYKDSREYIIKCKEEIERLQNELVTKQKRSERNKKILRGLLIAAIVCAVVLSFVFGLR